MTRWLPIAGLRHAAIPGRRSLNSALNRAVSGAGLMLELAAHHRRHGGQRRVAR